MATTPASLLPQPAQRATYIPRKAEYRDKPDKTPDKSKTLLHQGKQVGSSVDHGHESQNAKMRLAAPVPEAIATTIADNDQPVMVCKSSTGLAAA